MAATFSYKLQILEHHLDSYGHVNNAVYLQLFEEARWDFITTRSYGLEEINQRGFGPVVLELQLKFRKELLNREWITIESVANEMEHKLIGSLSQVMKKESGQVAATLDLKVGLMDIKARKLTPPTKDWLHAIGLD